MNVKYENRHLNNNNNNNLPNKKDHAIEFVSQVNDINKYTLNE